MLKFFRWALEHGGDLAKELDYVPVPADTVRLVEDAWKDIEGIGGLPVAAK